MPKGRYERRELTQWSQIRPQRKKKQLVLSPVIVIAAIVSSEPPDSAAEKELKRRYREDITRQAKAQYQKKE